MYYFAHKSITNGTGGCQFDNFSHSQWRFFPQKDVISVSVVLSIYMRDSMVCEGHEPVSSF